MALAKIFKPVKSTMQSGRAKTDGWVLEWEQTSATRPERLMGWTASSDMQTQCQLHFETREEAVALARAYAATGQPGKGLEVIDKTLKRTGANVRLEKVREEIASKGPGK